MPYEVIEITDEELNQKKFLSECTPAYRATLRGFVTEHIAHRLAEVRRSRGMFDALERQEEWDDDTDLNMGASCTFCVLLFVKLLT